MGSFKVPSESQDDKTVRKHTGVTILTKLYTYMCGFSKKPHKSIKKQINLMVYFIKTLG